MRAWGEAAYPYVTALGASGPHDGDMLLRPYVEVQNRLSRAEACQAPEVRIIALQNKTFKSLTDQDFFFLFLKPVIKLSITDSTGSSQLFITR